MKPLPMDAEDDLVREPVQAEQVQHNVSALDRQRARRAHHAIRRYRQGQQFFRLYKTSGPRVEVLAIEAKYGKAVVEGKRGVYAVALCDLFPDDR